MIAESLIEDNNLVLYLENRYEYFSTLDECVQVNIPLHVFAKLIRDEGLNSYATQKMHPVKKFVYKTRVEIAEPIAWYESDATRAAQQWAREAMLKQVLTLVAEGEVSQ